MPLQFASRLNNVETSAIRELFKLLGKPGIISFAGGFPDSAMFDVEGLKEASQKALAEEPGGALQYGATEGYEPLRSQLAAFMQTKGVKSISPEGLIVTTGSQQALDLLGKTMISPGDKVIVEAPTFLATIQCFRLYGADLITAPIDANGVQTDKLEAADRRAQAQVRVPDPHLRQPQRRHAERRAPQARAGAGREVPDAGGGGRSVRRPVLRRSAAAQHPGAERRVPGSREWIAHCGSMSKVLSPGLRVGWLIAQPELLAKATMCKQFSDAHTSTFAQATAAQYLKAAACRPRWPTCARSMASGRRVMGESAEARTGRRHRIHAAARRIVFLGQADGGGREDQGCGEFAKRAIEQGVAFVPGAPFYAKDPDVSTLRLSFATADVGKIEEGVGRLGRATSIVRLTER